MIPENKFAEIAKGLLEKTRRHKVDWHGANSLPNRPYYFVVLPKSRIELEYVSPPTEPDFIRLVIKGHQAIPAGTWQVQEEDPDWELAKSLYDEVVRFVTGWDEVLEEVEQFIKS